MLFYIILILFAVLIILAFVFPVNVDLLIDSGEMNMQMSLSWIHVIRIQAETIQNRMRVSVLLLKAKVFSRLSEKGKEKTKRENRTVFKALSLEDTHVKASYGFNEPYLTGILCGAISCAEALIKKTTFEQIPEFFPAQEFIKIEVRSKLNAGKTALNFIKFKSKESKGEEGMDQTNLNEHVDSLFHSLENYTQNEGIIGKSVTQGDKTFLPIVSITVGFGGGNASMKGQQANQPGMGSNTGTGALGLGAKVCTDAVIVIDGQNVNLLPISSSATNIMDKIPQVISSMNLGKQAGQSGQSGQTNQNNSQGQTYGGIQS